MNIWENMGSLYFPHSFLAVLVLVDVSDHWTRNSLSKEVLKCLSQFPQIPSVLVLNKVNEELVLSAPAEHYAGVIRQYPASAATCFQVPESECVKRRQFPPLLPYVEVSVCVSLKLRSADWG